MIATQLSHHAERQAQRRGVARKTLDLILGHNDRSQKIWGNARILWISRQGREQLVRQGIAARDVSRTSGVMLILHLADDVVMSVQHADGRRRRRHWA